MFPWILTFTSLGTAIGFFPIRDILSSQKILVQILARLYHTSHKISPPTPCLRASRPVITPRGVVRMLIPKPPKTRGISLRPTYTRQPGLDTRSTREMALSLLGPYLR